MKKLMKRIISATIGLIMMVPLINIPTTVYAATSGTCGANLKWSYDGDETLTISGTGAMYDYAYGEAPWYSIREDFWIVNIKNGVTTIGKHAFVDGEMSTDGELNIANTVTSIGYGAFMDCSYLSYVELPNSLKTIGDYAFEGCNFTDIDIPASVTSIGEDAFCDCTRLEEINVSSSNTVYSSKGGILYNKAKTNLLYAPIGITGAISIPSGVTTISNYAFGGCKKITAITIPNTVTSIGNSAFNRCNKLTSISIPGSVKTMGTSAISNCTGLTTVTLNSGITTISNSMFSGCTALKSINIPNTVTSIGNSAFASCESITSISMGSGVKSIGNTVFNNCKVLTKLVFPDSVTSVGYPLFYKCNSLTDITLGSGISTLDPRLFEYCSKLSTINVSTSNKSFSAQNGILYDKNKTKVVACPRAKTGSITLPATVTSIGDSAFYYCDSITNISVPNAVTSIGNKSFYGCEISKINIPTKLEYIGEEAFQSCEGLTSAILPDSVTHIGAEAFYNCSAVTTVKIGNGITDIKDGVFHGCESLTEIDIPSNVKSIGVDAFSGCDSLSNVKLNEGLQTIGEDAFYNCFSIGSITIPYSVTKIDETAFDKCESLSSVIIPPNVVTIGNKAFYRCSTGLVIKGKSGSQAETYAKSNSITFSALSAYTITYNANGGNGAPVIQTKLQGVNIPISSTVPTRSGCQFKGWSTSAGTQTISYQPGATYSGNANVILYAVWSTDYPTAIKPSTKNVNLVVGDNEQVYITVEPDFAINKAITWSTDNPGIATVNDGLITGVGAGTTSVIAKTANNIQEKITVTVVKPANNIDFVLEEIKNNASSSRIKVTVDGDISLVKSIKMAKGSQNENYFVTNGTSIELSDLDVSVKENGIYTFCLTDIDDNTYLKIINISKIAIEPPYFVNDTGNLKTTNQLYIPISFSEIDDTIEVYVALYDNGKLIKMQKELCIPSENIGKKGFTTRPFTLAYPKPGYELKSFIWNKNIMPLAESTSLTANNNSSEQIVEGKIADSESVHTITVSETREYTITSYTDSSETAIALEAYLFGESDEEFWFDFGKTNFEIKAMLTAGKSYELVVTNGNSNASGNYIVVIK